MKESETSKAMKVHGRCHCGAISFEAVVDPALAAICNCTDCQRFSGSAFRAIVPTDSEHFRLHGAPRIYVKIADSGRRRAQAFCETCGTSIYSADADDPMRFNIRLGLLDERDQIPARTQIWRTSALEWAQNISVLPAAPQDDFVGP